MGRWVVGRFVHQWWWGCCRVGATPPGAGWVPVGATVGGAVSLVEAGGDVEGGAVVEVVPTVEVGDVVVVDGFGVGGLLPPVSASSSRP